METWTLSWSKLLPLNKENIEKLDKNIAGVYRISREEESKTIVFFISETKDLKNDLLNILNTGSNECVDATVKSYSCYFRYSIIEEINVIEATLRKMYKVYQPQCNQNDIQAGENIEVNLN